MVRIKLNRKILLTSLLVMVLLPLCIAAYWVVDAGALELRGFTKSSNDEAMQNIEEQSLIHAKSLEYFYRYSQNTEQFEEWIDSRTSSSDLIIDGEVYLANTPIELKGLYENDCNRVYCYQSLLDFSQIPSPMWRGLIGIEDYRFLSHQGVDPISIVRALVVDIISMRFVQGGSTLTMQLVKNLFLTSEKSIIRKLKEMVLAIYIEFSYSKEEILTAYFNEVWWGSLQGIRIKGLHSASLAYFGKHPRFLNDYEASILVSLLKGPGFYHPLRHTNRLQQRVNIVIKKLQSLGLIGDDKSSFWTDKDWNNWIKTLKRNNDERPLYAQWLVTSKIESDSSQLERFVLYLGVERVKQVLKKRIEDKDIGIKLISHEVNCEDCKVLKYYSKYERNLENALYEEKHQTGSIFKPLFYNLYTKDKIAWDDLVKTTPFTLNLKSGDWSPKESSEIDEEEITVERALQLSRNRPTIRLAREYGFDELAKKLKAYFPKIKEPLSEYPSQLIGAIELSVYEVNLLYRRFISEECEQNSDELGTLDAGSVLARLSKPTKTTIRRVANRFMKNLSFFGKTGTTNNGLDSWYSSFDGKYVHTVWFGLEGERTDKALLLSGASSAYRVFQEYRYANGKRFHELSCPKD